MERQQRKEDTTLVPRYVTIIIIIINITIIIIIIIIISEESSSLSSLGLGRRTLDWIAGHFVAQADGAHAVQEITYFQQRCQQVDGNNEDDDDDDDEGVGQSGRSGRFVFCRSQGRIYLSLLSNDHDDDDEVDHNYHHPHHHPHQGKMDLI